MIHLSRDKVIIYDAQYTTLNRQRINMKHFLGPILGVEVAQKRAPFPVVVTITEMGNAIYAYYVMSSRKFSALLVFIPSSSQRLSNCIFKNEIFTIIIS